MHNTPGAWTDGTLDTIIHRMPFAYYSNLNRQQRRSYDASDAVGAVRLPYPMNCHAAVGDLLEALEREDQKSAERACRALATEIIEQLGAPPVRVRVRARRPVDETGELHGLYEPAAGRRWAMITLWMRTAKKNRVVAFRSFLRTLLHELVHHLDYEWLGLEETFHTEGFYKRESSLFHQLTRGTGAVRRTRR